ncbi:MAG: ribosomal protein [Spirosoma sp.]|nr:ribosomal protein [Spirosoma sp.]
MTVIAKLRQSIDVLFQFTFKSDTMRLQMHAVKFTADQSLLDFVQAKLDKLDTFHDHIIGAEVFLRLDGADSNKVKEKVVEVRLTIPGKELFVKEHDKSFESATDRVLDVLKDKLVRCKQKRSDFSSPAITEIKSRVEVDEVLEPDEI